MGNDQTRNVILVAVGSGLLLTGVLTLGVAVFGPAIGLSFGQGFLCAAALGLLVVFVRWQEIARGELDLWREANRVTRAQRQADAARHQFEAAAYMAPALEDSVEDAERLPITTGGARYTVSRLSLAEQKLMDEIGECLRFLSLGERAKGYSFRLMFPYRPAGWTKGQFEQWWTARGNALVGWGLFEKDERHTTRPSQGRTVAHVRRALLRREFTTAPELTYRTGTVGTGQTDERLPA